MTDRGRMVRAKARRGAMVLAAFAGLAALAGRGASVGAQAAPGGRAGAPDAATRAAVLAVVDSAMAAINAGEMVRLSDLMTPEGQVYAARLMDGTPGYRMRTAAEQRAQGQRPPIIERGFSPDVRVAGEIAVVWLPYDLYVERRWSHCGVDVFTLVRTGPAWRIANLTYSVEQPPACAVHPSGPAPGTTGTPR